MKTQPYDVIKECQHNPLLRDGKWTPRKEKALWAHLNKLNVAPLFSRNSPTRIHVGAAIDWHRWSLEKPR